MFLTLPTRLSAEPTTSVKLGRRSAGLPGRECDSRSVVRLPLDSPGLLPVTTTKCTMYSKIEGLVIFEHYSVHLRLWMKFYLNSSKIQVHYWSLRKSLISLWPKGKQWRDRNMETPVLYTRHRFRLMKPVWAYALLFLKVWSSWGCID